jgi:hypothetical protein
MRRTTLHILAVVSLLAAVAAAWAWRKSNSHLVGVNVWWPMPQFGGVYAYRGALYLDTGRWVGARQQSNFADVVSLPLIPEFRCRFDSDDRVIGVRYGPKNRAYGLAGYYFVGLSFYWLMPLCLVIPSLWVARRRREHRLGRMGGCLHCGYDLRATPERCPECGAVPTAKPARPGGNTVRVVRKEWKIGSGISAEALLESEKDR